MQTKSVDIIGTERDLNDTGVYRYGFNGGEAINEVYATSLHHSISKLVDFANCLKILIYKLAS